MKTSIYLYLATLFIVTACDPAENKFQVVNNSNADIYCFYSCDSIPKDIFILRNDYYRSDGKDSAFVMSDNFIKANSSKRFVERGYNAWTHYIKVCDDKFYVYYFDDSVVVKNTDQDLKLKKLYLRRDVFTLNELKSKNWTISYP